GWMDKSFTRPLQGEGAVHPILRVASNQERITRAMVMKLLDDGHIDPDTPVFPLLRTLGLQAVPGVVPHPEIDTVTVAHLLAEEVDGGVGLPEPPADASFYEQLGISAGSERPEDNIRWIYSFGGPATAASSGGYMVLRYLVHLLRGGLPDYLDDFLLQPGSSELIVAHERLEHRSSREPFYA